MSDEHQYSTTSTEPSEYSIYVVPWLPSSQLGTSSWLTTYTSPPPEDSDPPPEDSEAPPEDSEEPELLEELLPEELPEELEDPELLELPEEELW